MHVISRKKLLEAGIRYSALAAPLDAWYRISKKANWQTLVDVKANFPSADLVGKLIVFNVKGNEYRLITEIFFANQTVLVRAVLTHSEYDKGKWKS